MKLGWRRLIEKMGGAAECQPPLETPADFIDAEEIVRNTPLAEHVKRADHYFAWMGDDAGILKKPYNSVAEAAETLQGMSLILRFSDLFPGARVMDFGAGSCWLARDLALLGCDVTAVDISEKALALGKRFNDKLPFAADMTIDYHVFDGENLGLPDGYFDNIVCFASFHHVAAEDQLLKHFHRVLRPGGIASFYEPGPNHSRHPQSQAEMRQYGVIERDIDIGRIWRSAQAAGFADIKLARFLPEPKLVGLAEFDAMLARPASVDFGTAYANVRPFFLYKAGLRELDSRFGRGLAAKIDAKLSGLKLHIELTNIGEARWLPSNRKKGGVCIASKLLDENGHVLDAHYCNWWVIDRDIEPGGSFTADVEVPAPPRPGLRLSLGLVADRVAHFDGPGNLGCILEF
jgi:SAM-dependent methyltransferase